jgi:hypothetical protein
MLWRVQVMFRVFSGLKPDVPDDMPEGYKRLMQDCWDTEPASRPTFRNILARLRPLLAAALAEGGVITASPARA